MPGALLRLRSSVACLPTAPLRTHDAGHESFTLLRHAGAMEKTRGRLVSKLRYSGRIRKRRNEKLSQIRRVRSLQGPIAQMKRFHLIEIHDQEWCPRTIRDAETDYLQFVIANMKGYAAVGSCSGR